MIAFPKPTRAERMARQLAAAEEQHVDRAICRMVVWRREHGRCQGCARELALMKRHATSQIPVAHVDEQPPRSRGGDPTDPTCCVLLCPHCHQEQHRRAPERRILPTMHGWPA